MPHYRPKYALAILILVLQPGFVKVVAKSCRIFINLYSHVGRSKGQWALGTDVDFVLHVLLPEAARAGHGARASPP